MSGVADDDLRKVRSHLDRTAHGALHSCHQTFTGTTAGDMHRTGDHAIFEGTDRRRCLTADEMREKGMAQNDRGVWTTGKLRPAHWWEY